MKSFVTKLLIAIFGFSLVSAPLAANAAQWGVRVGYRNGWRPGGYRHGYGYRPAPVAWYPAPAPARVYFDGYYGLAPGGYYGYYWHGRWFAHRRWNGGIWVYF